MSDKEPVLEVRKGDTLPNTLRRLLADEILEGRIPPGERLDESRLAARFHISRTPVREALRQLHSANLVEIKPNRGAVVISPDKKYLDNLFETAAEIEAMCAKFAASRMTLLERKQLADLHERCVKATAERDVKEYARLNREFLTTLIEGMHNPFFAAFVQQILVQTGPYRKSQFEIEGRLESSNNEHALVVEAIKQSDRDGAFQAMHAHATEVYFAAFSCIGK